MSLFGEPPPPTIPEPWPEHAEMSDAEFIRELRRYATENERHAAHGAASLHREAARRIEAIPSREPAPRAYPVMPLAVLVARYGTREP